MDPERVRSFPRRYMRSTHITIRVSKDVKYWLRDNRFSATKIFYEAIKELGYKYGEE